MVSLCQEVEVQWEGLRHTYPAKDMPERLISFIQAHLPHIHRGQKRVIVLTGTEILLREAPENRTNNQHKEEEPRSDVMAIPLKGNKKKSLHLIRTLCSDAKLAWLG